MGNCNNRTLESPSSIQLGKVLEKDHKIVSNVNKLLLLGAGESGKSTLFKQCLYLYGEGRGYQTQDRKKYIRPIMTNIIQSAKELVRFVLEHQSSRFFISEYLSDTVDFVIQMKDSSQITPELAEHFYALWQDPAIQVAYSRRNEFQLFDSAKYFFDKVKEICQPNFVPKPEDIFRVRIRTTGIVEAAFEIQGTRFKMFDVGGQRSERKKWIHCFENVTAVIFVSALSVYDQQLFEDHSTNRMLESLCLFEELINSKWFTNSALILFLNKKDLFAEKIKKTPITKVFPNFPGNSRNYNEVVDFLIQVFESKNHTNKTPYTHVTCATDTTQMAHVFQAVRDTVTRMTLYKGGLM